MDVATIGENIREVIQETVCEVGWPDLSAAMEWAFVDDAHRGVIGQASLVLPASSCFAAGGKADDAVPLAASWRLYTLAARVFDDLVDRDKHDAPWNQWNPDRALHVGIGLLFAAQTCLARLAPNVTPDILACTGKYLLLMTYGQATPPLQPSLEAYLQHIITKTGFYSAAFARAGARLYTEDPQRLQAMFDYGLSLGILTQLRNDASNISSPYIAADLAAGCYTLPVIYGLSCLKHPDHTRLKALLESRGVWTEKDWETVRDILIRMEAPAYCARLVAVYATKARKALEAFPPDKTYYLRMLLPSDEAYT